MIAESQIKTARDLIRTATSLGILEGDGAARTFSSLAMSDDTLLYYAQLIAEVEGTPVRIINSPLWRLAPFDGTYRARETVGRHQSVSP